MFALFGAGVVMVGVSAAYVKVMSKFMSKD